MKVLRSIFLVVALVMAPQAVFADEAVGNGNATIGGWAYSIVTNAGGNTVVKAAPGVILGIINLATVAQSASVTCTVYDNASTNSGNVLYTETNIAAGQVIVFGSTAGINVANGITVNCTGGTTLSGSGILVMYK